MLKLLLFCLLLFVCWPLALAAVILYPLIWLVLLPFRLLGLVVGGTFEFIGALFRLPARVLRATAAELEQIDREIINVILCRAGRYPLYRLHQDFSAETVHSATRRQEGRQRFSGGSRRNIANFRRSRRRRSPSNRANASS